MPEVHLYRDYIIAAFNSDKPYDQFVREQLAGDILAAAAPTDRYAEQVIATGFVALTRRYGTMPKELWHLTIEDTIDTVGQAFLGLIVALRPLPRSQVRPGDQRGLLRTVRHLRQHALSLRRLGRVSVERAESHRVRPTGAGGRRQRPVSRPTPGMSQNCAPRSNKPKKRRPCKETRLEIKTQIEAASQSS